MKMKTRASKLLSAILALALFVTGLPQIAMAKVPDDPEWFKEYSHYYNANASLMSEPGNNLAGVYEAKAVKGADKTSELGIPSLAKQNLESGPTTESPAIIQGAAVPFEKRVNDSSTIRFDRISDEPVCAPYTYFRYELMEEYNANGTGTHTKISGFDGTYVIIRVDVSDLIKDMSEDELDQSYLHVKQSGNAAMQVLYGQDKSTDVNADGIPSYVKFSYNTLGAQAACFALRDNADALKDTDGEALKTPYVDIILLSSGTLVEGADKGGSESAQDPIKADFPISFYVDQTADYNPGIEWDEATKTIIDTNTREAVQPKQEGDVTITPDEMMLDKYYNEEKAKEIANEGGIPEPVITGYTVMGDDLELEVEVDEIREDASTEEEYWSLRRAMDYQEFDNHTVRLICEAPILDGLLLDDTDDSDGESNRHVILDVNSFDIQIANNTETNAAGLTVQGGATLEIMDASNTTGAELAVGNNANMLITGKGSTLIIDETCQMEVEYDSGSQAVAPEGEPQPELPDLAEGSLIIENGGKVINEGVITVEGKEGKAQDPVDAQTTIRDYKDAKLTIGNGGTLVNDGCMLVNGSLFNLGTIENNGHYNDLIVSDDPDKGIFTYHRGIQFSWKDDITQGKTYGGIMANGLDEDLNEDPDALLKNNGDIVLVPGYLLNEGTIENEGNIYVSAVNEVMIPITSTQDAPSVTEERIDLGYYEESYIANYEGAKFINKGNICTADFEIVSNGRTGNIKSEVSSALGQLKFYNLGTLRNEGNGVMAMYMLDNRAVAENKDNASFAGQYTVNGAKQDVVTKVLLDSDGFGGNGSFTDSSSKKSLSDVYNAKKTVEDGTNKWTYAELDSLTVVPASSYVGTGETVDWTIKATPEEEGDSIQYLVKLYLDNPKEPIETFAVPAGDAGVTRKSPAAPATKTNLSYSFTPEGVGNVSAQAVLHVNSDEEHSQLGVVKPTAMQNLVYNGEEQTLVTHGSAPEGTLLYKLGNGAYSTAQPKAKDAGTYEVTYKVVRNAGDPDEETLIPEPESPIIVTIAKRPLYLAADDQASKKGEPMQALTYTAFGLVNNKEEGIQEEDRDDLNLKIEVKLPAGVTKDSEVGAYPITLTIDENSDCAKNYEFTDAEGESRISNGQYFITNRTVDLSTPAPMPTPVPSPTPTPIPGIRSNFTGYQNMNESINLGAKYLKDESEPTKTTIADVYYSDTIELDEDNYKSDGLKSGTSYAAVGTDKTVYYYIKTPAGEEKTPEGEDVVWDALAGSQRVVIVKGDQQKPVLASESGKEEDIAVSNDYTHDCVSISNLKPREMEYRRADEETYKRIVTTQIDVAPGYYYYIRMLGTARLNPSPDLEIYAEDMADPIEPEGEKTKKLIPVTFDAGSGYFEGDPEVREKTVEVVYGNAIGNATPDAPARADGKAFVEWQLNGTHFDLENTPITTPYTLEAAWDVETCTVIFQTNGGLPVNPQIVEQGEKVALPEGFERTGYTLDGWFTDEACTDGNEWDFDTPVVDDPLILYAKWTPNPYTVTFNANTGSGDMDPQDFTYNTAQKLSANIFTKADHAFSGWNTDKDGKGRAYTDQQEVMNLVEKEDAEHPFTLYAQWKKQLTSADITMTIANENKLIYNGKAQKPGVIIKDGTKDITKFFSFVYKDNVNASSDAKKARVTAKVKSTNAPYVGEISKEFTIQKDVYKDDPDNEPDEYRQYLYTKSPSVDIDLSSYLPADRGETTWEVADYDTAGGFNFDYDGAPEMDEEGVLSFDIKKADAPGGNATIYVTAETQNYKPDVDGKDEFKFMIVLDQTGLAIAEKSGKNYVQKGMEMHMCAGAKITLAALYADETVVNKRVRWSSTDPAVATITQDGKVTALAPGFTEITVYSEELGAFAITDLTVTEPVSSLSLDRKSYSMGTGEVVELFASAVPFTADRTLTWTVDNDENAKIISVSENTQSAKIIAQKPGKVKVTASTTDGSKKTAVCNITIGNPAGKFTVSPKGKDKAVAVGKTLGFKVDWIGDKPKNTDVIWQVRTAYGEDASKIATISQKGVLTGFSEGLVRITAISVSNPEKTASTEVAVYVPVKKATLNVTSGTLSQADRDKFLDLDAFVTPSVAGSKATGVILGTEPNVKYEVDPKYAEIVSVDSTGRVKIRKAVENTVKVKNIPVYATVTAYNGYSKKLTCKVTIKDNNTLKKVKLSATKLTIGEGNLVEISASLDPLNADGQSILWGTADIPVSDNEAVAKVITKKVNNVQKHYVQGVGTGTANITVTASEPVGTKTITATCKVTVKPSVKAIAFKDADKLMENGLAVGKTFTLKPEFELTADGKAASTELIYTSSNEKIATVSAKGVIKAIAPRKPGEPEEVTITATSADVKAGAGINPPSKTITFNVYAPVTKVVLDKTKLTIGTRDKIPDVHYDGNCYGKISIATMLPENASDTQIRWVADNENVVITPLDEDAEPADGDFTGAAQEATTEGAQALAVKGLIPGTTKLNGVTLDGSNKKVSCTVTIRGDVTKLSLKTQDPKNGYNDVTFVRDNTEDPDPEQVKPWIEYSSNMKAGTSLTLTPLADINGISATNADAKKTYNVYKKYTDTSVSYISSDTQIAKVTNAGKITVNREAAVDATVDIFVFDSAENRGSKLTITIK